MKKNVLLSFVAIAVVVMTATLTVLAADVNKSDSYVEPVITENSIIEPIIAETSVHDTIDTLVETPTETVITEEELPETNEKEVVEGIIPIETYGLLSVEKVTAMNDFAEKNMVKLEVVPQFTQGDMVVFSAEKALEEIPYRTTFLPKYRDIYYWGPSFLIDLVGREAAGKWHNEVVQPNIDNNTEPEEMYLVSFIKYFGITKDVFEKECEEKRAYDQMLHDEYGIDITGEGYEIPNADILYTFDNEIINNYYLREQSNVELTK